MTLVARSVTPSSQIGGVIGPQGRVDALSLTDAANIKRVQVTLGAFTQNTTVKAWGGALGFRGTLIGAYISFLTVPAGGALLVNVVVQGSTALTMASVDPETAVTVVGLAMTLDATNQGAIHAATDVIEVDTVADNNSVGTAQVGGICTLLFRVLEPTTGSTHTA